MSENDIRYSIIPFKGTTEDFVNKAKNATKHVFDEQGEMSATLYVQGPDAICIADLSSLTMQGAQLLVDSMRRIETHCIFVAFAKAVNVKVQNGSVHQTCGPPIEHITCIHYEGTKSHKTWAARVHEKEDGSYKLGNWQDWGHDGSGPFFTPGSGLPDQEPPSPSSVFPIDDAT